LPKITSTPTTRLRPQQESAPIEPLAGHNTCEFVRQSFVLAEQITDLAPTHTNVTRRHVSMGAHVSEQLRHERLAKTHDFDVRFPLWVEIRAALAAAHR